MLRLVPSGHGLFSRFRCLPTHSWAAEFQSSSLCASRESRTMTGRISRRAYATTGLYLTKVEKIILDTIKATGPISFSTYMQLCLSHPTEGYYMNPSNPVFGAHGDFVTSPEISQVFGELVGIWLFMQWQLAGNARKIRLIELGPGRGTLMDDILRVFTQLPAGRDSIQEIYLIETSPPMRLRQEQKLASYEKPGRTLAWHGSIEDVKHDPRVFTLLVAHEFFDALPFHIIRKTQQGWQEVLIALTSTASQTSDPSAPNDVPRTAASSPTTSPSSNTSPLPRLHPVLSPAPTASSTLLGLSSKRFERLPVGSQIEVSPTAFKIARAIGELLHQPKKEETFRRSQSAGSALIIDYGDEKVFGDSFRAFKGHKQVDVFHRPGECDMTVNVDFAYIKEAVEGIALPLGPISQATFLTRMGLSARIEKLMQNSPSAERKEVIAEAAKRLVDTSGMGSQYQFLGLTGLWEVLPEESWPFVELETALHEIRS